jgi:aromatic ring hydroxylase
MLKTGEKHLESLRDGRVVNNRRERVDDVTAHSAVAAPVLLEARRSMEADPMIFGAA